MKTTFIQDPAELAAQFPRLLPLFERVPPVDEFTPVQLQQLAAAGKAHLGYVCDDDGEPVVAFVFEFIRYPNMMAANIIALAGDGFCGMADELFLRFREFCKVAGVDAIEALCGDGMARLLARHGFRKSNNQVRVRV